MINEIIMGLLIIYFGITNYIERERNHKREKDLLNRLMSKDFNEYAGNSVYMNTPPVGPIISEETMMKEKARLLEKFADQMPVD